MKRSLFFVTYSSFASERSYRKLFSHRCHGVSQIFSFDYGFIWVYWSCAVEINLMSSSQCKLRRLWRLAVAPQPCSVSCGRQGFDKNLYPHAFCWHTLRVHDIVWRMGFTRALLSTPILQTISWVMLRHHCANKRKTWKTQGSRRHLPSELGIVHFWINRMKSSNSKLNNS